MPNVLPVSLAQLQQFADNIALEDGYQQLSYRHVAQQVLQLSHWLNTQGYQRIAICGPNSVAWVIADLAVAQANKICVPIPVFFSALQQHHILQEANIQLLLFTEHHYAGKPTPIAGLWYQIRPAQEDNTPQLPITSGKITFTSGTTASPKGVCLSWQQQASTCEALTAALQAQFVQPHYLHFCLLPLATLLENQAGIYVPLRLGQRILILAPSSTGLNGSASLDINRFAQSLLHYQPASVILTPQLLHALIILCSRYPTLAQSFTFIAVGGAHCAPGLLARAAQIGLPVFQGYGLSEAGSVVALNLPQQQSAGSVGKPLPHISIKLVEQHIWLKGDLFAGYLGEPQRDPEQWLDTGDLGAIDADGYLYITGRSKHLVISSYGRNISPEWLEAELQLCPAVAQAMVTGDAKPWLSALVSLRPHATAQELTAQIQQLNSQLPDYARIRSVLLLTQPFSTDNHHLTDNGRLRRSQINHDYADVVDRLYSNEPDGLTPTITLVTRNEELSHDHIF